MLRTEISNLNKGKLAFFFSIVCIASVILVPRYFSPIMETLNEVSFERNLFYALWFALSFLICGEITGIFDAENKYLNYATFFLFLVTSALASLLLLLMVWVVEYQFIGRLTILKICMFTSLGTFLFYQLFLSFVRRNKIKVLLNLSLEESQNIKNAFGDDTLGFEFVNFKSQGGASEIKEFCFEQKIDLVIVENGRTYTDIDIVSLLEGGMKFMGLVEFYEKFLGRIPSKKLDQSWLVRLDLRFRNPIGLRLKRLLDLSVAVVGLLVSFPILVTALVFIVIESGFPSFFKQQRSGFLGRPYTLFKLRTMKVDAEKSGAKWAVEGDRRVTRVGSFLRKWRIDEIPQFWNVLKGDMSVVGPRPERPEFQEELNKEIPHWNCRHLVKPGLTGWAQIRFRYASDSESSEEKLAYDLYYIKNASIILDIQIILSTLRSVAKGSR